PRFVRVYARGDADLRLALRRREDRDGEQMVAVPDVDGERREEPGVRENLRAVDEHLALVVDAVELQRAAADARTVDPRAVGRPLGEPRVPLEVGRRHLARMDEIVDD